MTVRIRFLVPAPRVLLRDTSPKTKQVDPLFVQQALGATVAGSSKGMDLVTVAHTMMTMVRTVQTDGSPLNNHQEVPHNSNQYA